MRSKTSQLIANYLANNKDLPFSEAKKIVEAGDGELVATHFGSFLGADHAAIVQLLIDHEFTYSVIRNLESITGCTRSEIGAMLIDSDWIKFLATGIDNHGYSIFGYYAEGVTVDLDIARAFARNGLTSQVTNSALLFDPRLTVACHGKFDGTDGIEAIYVPDKKNPNVPELYVQVGRHVFHGEPETATQDMSTHARNNVPRFTTCGQKLTKDGWIGIIDRAVNQIQSKLPVLR